MDKLNLKSFQIERLNINSKYLDGFDAADYIKNEHSDYITFNNKDIAYNSKAVAFLKESSVINPQEHIHEISSDAKINWINNKYSNIVESNEAKTKLYDYIHDKSVSFDDIIRANASAHKNDTLYHSMSVPFIDMPIEEAEALISKGDIAIADNSLKNIISNKDIELAVSNVPIYDIGIKGKGDVLGYFKSDVGSLVDNNGTRYTNRTKGKSVILDEILQGKRQYGNTYHEGFAKNFEIESLFVREKFYNEHKQEVIDLLKKHNLEKIDVIGKNNEIIKSFDFGKLTNNIELYSDEYYLFKKQNPEQQRKSIKELYESKNAELPEELKKYFSTEEPKPKNNNIIDKIFEFEDNPINRIATTTTNIITGETVQTTKLNLINTEVEKRFEELSKGNTKLYSELLYRPEEYRQTLSNYYESLKTDIRPFSNKVDLTALGADMEPLMHVQNIFAKEYGFESYNDLLKYANKNFDGKTEISIQQILDLNKEFSKSTDKTPTVTVENNLEKPITSSESEPKTKVNQKNLEQATEEITNKTTKAVENIETSKAVEKTSKMTTKGLSGGGKLAIGLAITGIVIGASLNDNKDKHSKKDEKANKHVSKEITGYTNTNSYDESSLQIAYNISNYGYGKRIGGMM